VRAGAGLKVPLTTFDVVVVPFPFTDRMSTKRRPALVLSSQAFNQASRHAVLTMITSADQATWPGDCALADPGAAGLTAACIARLKLFTLDERLIIRACGHLATADQKRLRLAWKGLLGFH
jgi:mRNA interferase MazF